MENFPEGHYLLMEDNGPKHTSHVAKDVHADKGWSRVVKLMANTCKQLSGSSVPSNTSHAPSRFLLCIFALQKIFFNFNRHHKHMVPVFHSAYLLPKS